MSKFEIFRDKKDSFRFRLLADNGQNILTSQAYSSKAACINGIKSVIRHCQNENDFEELLSRDGRLYFSLKAKNGLVIATSQMYASQQGLDQGIASVKKNALFAEIVEIKVQFLGQAQLG